MKLIKQTNPKAQRYHVCNGREQLLDFEDGLHTPEIAEQIDTCKGIEFGKKYLNQTQRIDGRLENWKSCARDVGKPLPNFIASAIINNQKKRKAMFVTNDLRPTREEIIEKAHIGSTTDLCRKYASDDFAFQMMPIENFERLRDLIQIEIDKLLSDPTYQMITKLKVKDKIKRNKDGIFLRISGSYFSDRQGISFNKKNGFIGFCAEMDGCNRIPFVVGFINWIDELRKKPSILAQTI